MIPDGLPSESVDVRLPLVGSENLSVGVELLSELRTQGTVRVSDLRETREQNKESATRF